MGVLDAVAREVERFSALLDELSDEDWRAPTRCPPMNVMDLVAHVSRGAFRIDDMLDAGVVDSEAEKDGATYFAFDTVAEGPAIVARAQHAAAEYRDPAALRDAFRDRWAAALGRARADLAEDDRMYMSISGAMRLSEYLRTRAVEVTVHHMDVRDALGRDPDPDPGALEETARVLRDLLGTDARALGIPDVRFVLIGTGRAPLTGAERDLFGPLAERFPLLA